MNIMNALQIVGINPFAVTLLAESVLKSPLAPTTVGNPQRITFPINRSDCAGWAGVRITVEAVPEADRDAPWPPRPTAAEVEALRVQVRQADERGDLATRRAHAALNALERIYKLPGEDGAVYRGMALSALAEDERTLDAQGIKEGTAA